MSRAIVTVLILALGLAGPLFGQGTARINGTVTSTAGAPLAGAQVVVVGTGLGGRTGADGRYSIDGVRPGTHRVRAEMVGYAPREASVRVAAGETATASLQLTAQAVELEGVVAVGYGTQRKRDITGSVASVSAEALKETPLTSLDQGLQGRVAGVQVTQSSGQPGASATIRIRGGTSINAGNEPLYVIDGVPVYNSNGAASPGATRGPDINALATVNPNDIESIEILKDASATAIYGSRGANGVILITTKRGRAGQNQASFESYYSMNQVRRTLPVMSAQEYARFVNDREVNSGLRAPYTEAQIAALGSGTDWQDELFRAAPTQNHQASFSGGDDRTRYTISGSLFNQEGVILGSDFNRASVRLNLDRAMSSRFRVGNNLTLTRSHTNQAITDTDAGRNGGLVLQALYRSPLMSVRDEKGSFLIVDHEGNLVVNPVQEALELTNEAILSRALGNVFAEYTLLEGLTARATLGGDYIFAKENFYAPRSTYRGLGTGGQASVGSVQNGTWLSENTVTLDRTFGDRHSLNALAGVSMQGFRREGILGASEGFSTDALQYRNLRAGTVYTAPNSFESDWGLLSYLGRVNYSLDNRYLFTLTTRADGSSRFGAGNKYGFFPSGSFAWRLSEEPFVERVGIFDDLKLRTSYGRTGNQEIPVYQSLGALAPVGTVFGNTLNVGFAPSRIANPNLKWESTSQFDVGMDASFFANRLSVTADYYHKKTDDLLLFVELPWTSGYTQALQNLGSLENRGFEMAITSVNLEGPLGWTTTLNGAVNRSKVLDLGELESFFEGGTSGSLKINSTGIVKVGKPLGSFYGYREDGIFQNAQEIASSAQRNAKPGDIRYQDLNGDGVINDSDRTILGNAQPKFIGGMSNDFQFGGLELSVFLQGSYGNKLMNLTRLEFESQAEGMSKALVNRWTPHNTDSNIPRAVKPAPAIQVSDRIVEDGSYLRLKTVSLSYALPESLNGALRMSSSKLYVSGQNLWTWTKYSGYDPEVSRFGQDNLAQGIDLGGYPMTRSVLVGMSVGF